MLLGCSSQVIVNRDYVLDYVMSMAPPFFGLGLGNASLEFAGWMGTQLMPSHQSLYVHYWFALGAPGVAICLLLLTLPLVSLFRRRHMDQSGGLGLLLAAQGAWLLLYAGHTEVFAL